MSTTPTPQQQAAAQQLHHMTGLHLTEWLNTGSPERLEFMADMLLALDHQDEAQAKEAARLYRIAQGESDDDLLQAVLHQHDTTDGPPRAPLYVAA